MSVHLSSEAKTALTRLLVATDELTIAFDAEDAERTRKALLLVVDRHRVVKRLRDFLTPLEARHD